MKQILIALAMFAILVMPAMAFTMPQPNTPTIPTITPPDMSGYLAQIQAQKAQVAITLANVQAHRIALQAQIDSYKASIVIPTIQKI